MSDPTPLREAIDAAEDAFGHVDGRPHFEPGLDSSADATDGKVQIQKACRLLALTNEIDDVGEYYGATLEHSFIAIEGTLQGYLLSMTGVEAADLRDHTSPYEFASGRVPLTDETIESLQALYQARRTEHYYGTTVTTRAQARRMRTVAQMVHDHIISFDPELQGFCLCNTEE